MKKLIIILLFISTSLLASYKFLGVDLGADLTVMKSKLESRFKLAFKRDGLFSYKGNFLGYKSQIHCTHYKNKVASIGVFIAVNKSNCVNCFNKITGLYTKKYGKPTTATCEFKIPYTQNDGYNWQAVRTGNANIFMVWDTKKYRLYISVMRTKDIMIAYFNNPVFEAKQDKENSLLSKDL